MRRWFDTGNSYSQILILYRLVVVQIAVLYRQYISFIQTKCLVQHLSHTSIVPFTSNAPSSQITFPLQAHSPCPTPFPISPPASPPNQKKSQETPQPTTQHPSPHYPTTSPNTPSSLQTHNHATTHAATYLHRALALTSPPPAPSSAHSRSSVQTSLPANSYSNPVPASYNALSAADCPQ